MTCEHCDDSRRNGEKFCPYCGSEIQEIPMVPPQVAAEKHKERRTLSEIAFALGLIISILLTVILVLELFTAISKMGFVIDGINENDYSFSLFIVTPYIIDLFKLSGTALIAYYCILIVVIVASLALLYHKSFRPYLNIGKDGGKSARHSDLFEMTVLFAVMLAIEIVYLRLVNATDTPIDKTPLWQKMFSLLSASVWEEVITRFLLIGVPVAIIYMVVKRDKREIKKIVGGFDSFNILVIALIIISALIFALAHVVTGSWGMWKVFPTFLFGLIAGYLFVKYGLHVAIAIHFLNDYLSSESWLVGSNIEPFTNMIIVIVCIFAIPYIYIYGKRIFMFFKNGIDKF